MQNKARVTPVPEIFEGKAFAYRLGLLAFPHFQPCTEDVFAELVSCSSHSNGRAAAGASMAWVPTEPVVVCLLSSALQRDGMRCNGGIDPPKSVTKFSEMLSQPAPPASPGAGYLKRQHHSTHPPGQRRQGHGAGHGLLPHLTPPSFAGWERDGMGISEDGRILPHASDEIRTMHTRDGISDSHSDDGSMDHFLFFLLACNRRSLFVHVHADFFHLGILSLRPK